MEHDTTLTIKKELCVTNVCDNEATANQDRIESHGNLERQQKSYENNAICCQKSLSSDTKLINQTCLTADYLELIPQICTKSDCEETPNDTHDTNSSIEQRGRHFKSVEIDNYNVLTINKEHYETIEECFKTMEHNRVSIICETIIIIITNACYFYSYYHYL